MSTLDRESCCPSGARRYHHGNLRDALLERAAEVIGSEGIEALSLRALARDLGVSHAAPGRHFQTRTDLLAALAEDGVDRLIAATESAMAASGGDPVEQLRSLASAYLQWANEHPAHYNAVRNPEVVRCASPGLKAKMMRFAEKQRATLRQAQAAGWMVEVDLDLLMFQFVATLVGSATVISDPLYREVLGPICAPDRVGDIVERAFPRMTASPRFGEQARTRG